MSRQAVTKWEADESEPSIENIEKLSNIFHVSIDGIIKGNCSVPCEEKENQETEEERMRRFFVYEQSIHVISRKHDFGAVDYLKDEYSSLADLFKAEKCKYVDENGEILEKYLVANTTQEDREVMTSFICGPVSEPFQPIIEYNKGNIEIIQAIDEMIAELEKKEENEFDYYISKLNTKLGRLFNAIDDIICQEIDLEDYSDKKIDGLCASLADLMNEIQPNSIAVKTLLMYASELLPAIKNRDNKSIEKLAEEWIVMHASIWKLI